MEEEGKSVELKLHLGPLIERGSLASFSHGRLMPFSQDVCVRLYDKLALLELPFTTKVNILKGLRERVGQIRHPHLAQVIAAEDIRGTLALVYRLPPGKTLEEQCDEMPLSPEKTAHLLDNIASALHACRKAGLPHRAPTPDRIWLTESGDAYLLGLGEALYRRDLADSQSRHLTRLVWHLPPESLEQSLEEGVSARVAAVRPGQNGTDVEDLPAAEVHALGCLAFYALNGSHPFHADRHHAAEGFRRLHENNPIPFSPDLRATSFAEVVERALDSNPKVRQATPMGFVAEFRSAVDESNSQVILSVDATELHVAIDPEDSLRLRSALFLWRAATLILLTVCFFWGSARLQAKESVVITSTPPGIALQEQVGHTFVELGETPLVLEGRSASLPLNIRSVSPDGTRFGPLVEFDSGAHRSLGQCAWVDLELVFPEDVEGQSPSSEATPDEEDRQDSNPDAAQVDSEVDSETSSETER